MAFIIVTYRYSTSSDRVLDKEATWQGSVPGKSLATVMSEIRSRHRGATNISITALEWRDEDRPARPAAALERRASPADLRCHPAFTGR